MPNSQPSVPMEMSVRVGRKLCVMSQRQRAWWTTPATPQIPFVCIRTQARRIPSAVKRVSCVVAVTVPWPASTVSCRPAGVACAVIAVGCEASACAPSASPTAPPSRAPRIRSRGVRALTCRWRRVTAAAVTVETWATWHACGFAGRRASRTKPPRRRHAGQVREPHP